MKKIIFTLAILILTACTPAATQAPKDVQSLLDAANGDPRLAAVYANATGQAIGVIVNAQATLLAATQVQDMYNQQSAATAAAATATAEAPYIAMTNAAAQMAIQQMYSQATATEAERQAQATSTAGAATAEAAVTAQAFYVKQNNDALALQRATINNTMRATAGYAVLLIAVIVAILYAFVHLKRLSFSTIGFNEQGKVMPILNYIEAVVTDLDASANGTVSLTNEFVKLLPAITPDRQQQITMTKLLMDTNTRRARLPRALVAAQSLPEANEDETDQPGGSDFLLPAWEIINGWNVSKTALPYYTARGLETIDITKFPHLSAIGATGTGKSRRFFRPMLAAALAAGHRVMIVGKSADYWSFENHPNAALIKISKITEPGQAEFYAKVLDAIVQEMNRRDDVLVTARQSTWTHAGNSLTFIVLDELGNALRLMDRDTSNYCRTLVEGLVSEGRKVGFNLWLSNQRATGMSSILSQTGKAIFRVEADEERAHRSLLGASQLHEGYYLAKFGGSEIAGGFEPTDDEITKYLNAHPVATLAPDKWIEGVILNQPSIQVRPEPVKLPEPAPVTVTTTADFVNDLLPWQVEALELYQAGMDQAAIVAKVFADDTDKTVGTVAVTELIERWKSIKVKDQSAPVINTEDEQIAAMVGQGMSVSAIVRKLWGVTGGVKFTPLADRVKSFMVTSGSTSITQTTPATN